MGAIVPAGVIAIAGLIAGLVVVASFEKRAKQTEGIEAASGAYRTGCWIAGGISFGAGVVTIIIIFITGVGGGMWVPALLALAINLTGVLMAAPRIKRLRRLFYRPALPIARL